MPSANFNAIRTAMQHQQQMTCTYHGLKREFCPHTLGYKKGKEKVLGFQFAGQSSKGLPPGGEWRCMFVDEISGLQGRDGDWHTSNSHLRPQTCVDEIVLEVFA